MTPSVARADAPRIAAELVGRWDEWDRSYADVWGDGPYAFLCHFFDAGVDIIDIGDPFHPVQVAEIRAASPNNFSSAQDVQSANGLLFIALDMDGHDGVLIADIRNPLHPIQRTLVTVPNFADVHNVFYDSGYLFLANSRSAHVGIVDLTAYNPDAAPARITQGLWTLDNVGNSFIHDITVQNGRLYACAWNGGLHVYNLGDLTRRPPTLFLSAPGMSTHSCWATDNGRYVVTGEERGGGGIKVFEVRLPNPFGEGALILRDSVSLPLDEAYSVHNQLVRGNRLYNAWYQAGLTVHDIHPSTGALTEVTSFDTFEPDAFGFDGAWGVYPFLGDDKVLVSDIENGLFVIDVSGVPKFALPDGLPAAVHPLLPTPVSVRVLHSGGLDPQSEVNLHVNIVGREAMVLPLSAQSGGIYEGELPPVPCGESVDFFFQAQPLTGPAIRNPLQAPEVYSLTSRTYYQQRFHDDFEEDRGWTVGSSLDLASAGIWIRENPIGTLAQPENDNPLGTGSRCWVTGQGNYRSSAAQSDVDGGGTTLLSPAFDATGSEVFVGYARWFSNHLGLNPKGDPFAVSISNDSGMNWVPLETVTQGQPFWRYVRFRVSDFVQPTAKMRVRFVAADHGADSLVEAALDDFFVATIICSQLPGDADGNGQVGPQDIRGLPGCAAGPGIDTPPHCAAYDPNQDGDVDLEDVAAIFQAYSGLP